MEHPKKWRETIDPYSIKFNNFQLKKVLGYPHAGNDVFYVKGVDNSGNEVKAYLKVARQKTANIAQEVFILHKLDFEIIPEIIDFSTKPPKFLLTREIEGEKLSNLLKGSNTLKLKKYMTSYGELLAQIHSIDIECAPVKERCFFINHNFYITYGLQYVEQYLVNAIKNDSFCFIHGDCHYANILWKDYNVTGLLDFELSGFGSREYDLAWALTLRPEQNFIIAKKERDIILKSYLQYHSFCKQTFNYYLVLFSMFFYNISVKQNATNKEVYIKIIDEIIADKSTI